MFKELEPLLQERPITISLVVKDGVVHALIAPKRLKDDEPAAAWAPFALSGTLAELDDGFAAALETWLGARANAVHTIQASVEAATKELKRLADSEKAANKAKIAAKSQAAPAAATGAPAAPAKVALPSPQASLFDAPVAPAAPAAEEDDDNDE